MTLDSLAGLKNPEPRVVGQSPAWLSVLRLLDRVAPTDLSVLISGPTGAGKEVLAQLLHARGLHPTSPLLDLNCGALPEHLVEAELFGYAKGAFTGAHAAHTGHLERVGQGTLFLDEIGELPLGLQPKLLRVLETRTFRPLGSSDVKQFHGRVVAASHRDLEVMAREGRFREDLFYRLAVFVLDLPGLDRRVDDIPALVNHFAALQPRPLHFSPEALACLQAQPWPGHVRQLRNLVDRLGVLAEQPVISLSVLQAFLRQHNGSDERLTELADALLSLPGEDKLEAAETLMLERAMALSGGNKSGAARLLGISRKAVERRLLLRQHSSKSAQACLEAAQEHIRESDFKGALPLLRQGVEQHRQMPVTPEHRRLGFELHRNLGVCLRSTEGWLSADAVQAYEQAIRVGGDELSDRELTALLFGIWTTQLMTMDLGKARGTVQQMLQCAQASGEPEVSAEAHVAMANTLYWLGDSTEALACLQRGGLVPVRHQEWSGAQGFDLVGLALNFEGLAAFQTGDFRRAEQARLRLVARAEQLGDHPMNQAIALQGAAWLSCLFDDLQALPALAGQLESVSTAHGLVFYRGVGQIFRGVCLTAEGRFREAEDAIREGFETHMLKNGGKLFYSFQAWKMGELLLRAGRHSECEGLMAQAQEVVLGYQDRACLAELMDVQGRARQAMGDLDGAEEAFREAVSTAVALGAVPARLRSATHLADVLVHTGRQRTARDVLTKALMACDQDQPYVGLALARARMAALPQG